MTQEKKPKVQISLPKDSVIEKSFREALSERYLAFALSTIKSRSLPDVRDGLKPVHRRLIYAMEQLNLNPTTPPKKSARVVGDVIGKFHPHGDMAVYDALVRLAQDFSSRYPLILGQGNFGNVDGDNPAAMRYTEAKLTTIAKLLLQDIDHDAVDFKDTYDGDGQEPMVLPSNFPNLLANGSIGIAVGMATSIPPHNIIELAKALQLLIKKPQATVRDLMAHVKGPDFPLGGVLIEPFENILKAYETGRGSFRVRATWEKEDTGSGMYQIVVTQIPYQIQKSKLIERIADLLNLKKLPLLEDVRDESTEDIRLVLVPKSRNVKPEHLMQMLFKNTDLESRFSLNLNVIDKNNQPRVMSLRDVLVHYTQHRHEVLLRKNRHRLAKINHRLEVLEGLLITYLNLDRVIEIIRFDDEPKQKLMSEFNLTEVQVEAILNMRLRSLHKLEEMEIRREHDQLSSEKDGIEALLSSEDLQRQELLKEFEHLETLFKKDKELGPRRTMLQDVGEEEEIPLETMIEKEDVTIICSDKSWIRAVKGHLSDEALKEIKYKEGDQEGFILKGQSTDKILIFNSDGKFYTLSVDKLARGRGFGDPLSSFLDIEAQSHIVAMHLYQPGGKFIVAASNGRGFMVMQDKVLALTKNGKQVLVLEGKLKAYKCEIVSPNDTHVAVIGNNRKILIFSITQLPEMTKGRGVTLQKYKDAHLADLKALSLEVGMAWYTKSGDIKTQLDLRPWLGNRAGQGKMPPYGFSKENKFAFVSPSK